MYFRKFLKRIAFVLIYGIISTIIAFLMALLIQNRFKIQIYDSMTAIGLVIISIGALSTVGGNPTGMDMRSTSELNGQYLSQLNIEVTRMERDITKYFESTANHVKLYFSRSKINIILNGIFVILSSIALSYLLVK